MGACSESGRCCGHQTQSTEPEFKTSSPSPLSLTQRKDNNEALVRHLNKLSRSCYTFPKECSKKRIEQLKIVVHYAKLLTLTVVSSKTLEIGKAFTITAQGLEGGFRDVKDGYTFFGCKKRRKGEIVNDLVIKEEDKQISERHQGQHFMIEYNVEEDKYFVKDLGIGFGTFAKIEGPVKLKQNHLFSMGESFLIINTFTGRKPHERDNLKIKLFSGPSNGETLYVLFEHKTQHIPEIQESYQNRQKLHL
eukprot:TRINITY_DN72718_c0_g1_i1.p1 TRINITY_DN72718_c0_g1~~TRINITY_DN72718_c0_g1_i1.p1  ORF type:complete len:249 (+),score=18.07 TRINITY_DN72718_c0_g1_i1:118-864(+)